MIGIYQICGYQQSFYFHVFASSELFIICGSDITDIWINTITARLASFDLLPLQDSSPQVVQVLCWEKELLSLLAFASYCQIESIRSLVDSIITLISINSFCKDIGGLFLNTANDLISHLKISQRIKRNFFATNALHRPREILPLGLPSS